MALNVNDIRTELQLPTEVLADDTIASILVKVSSTDLNLVCAECLRYVIRSYRGRVRYRIGRFSETINTKDLKNDIRIYMRRSSATVTEATVEEDTEDPNFFKRDGM